MKGSKYNSVQSKEFKLLDATTKKVLVTDDSGKIIESAVNDSTLLNIDKNTSDITKFNGGTANQILTKKSDTDLDMEWTSSSSHKILLSLTTDYTITQENLLGNIWITNHGATKDINVELPKGVIGNELHILIEASNYLKLSCTNNEKFTFQGQYSDANGYIRSNIPTNTWSIIFTNNGWFIYRAEGPILCDM